jgi:hypothetical protein
MALLFKDIAESVQLIRFPPSASIIAKALTYVNSYAKIGKSSLKTKLSGNRPKLDTLLLLPFLRNCTKTEAGEVVGESLE